MYFHPKLKYLFSTHQRLSFGWAIILSVLLLSCDPDQDTQAPTGKNNITKICGNSAMQSLANKNQVGNNQAISYNDEPKFNEQWYLHNTNMKGLDINILPVWQKGYGTKPVSIGILDAGIDTTHPDLRDMILLPYFEEYDPKESHGSNVAGLIAARDNHVGMIGVAPNAKIYNYAIADNSTITNSIIPAFRQNHTNIAVYNASFGAENQFLNHKLHHVALKPSIKQAMNTVTKHGFDGKGSSLVFAAGNGQEVARNDGYLNYHAVIAVNAIKKDGIVPVPKFLSGGYTIGVNLWLTAPMGSVTSNNGGGYINNFIGTSATAPLVSGTIGLLRSEFPELTWRDVKLILAESARKYDKGDKAKYRKSGVLYCNPEETQKYSKTLGFGLLDVEQAFILAQNWNLLPPMKVKTYTYTNTDTTNTNKYVDEFSLDNSIQFIESLTIEIVLNADDDFFGDIKITSPNGLEAQFTYYGIPKNTTLLFNTFLGSPIVGKWKIETQTQLKDIQEISFVFRGH